MKQSGTHNRRYFLAYDADCGSCTRFKGMVQWFDKYNHLEYISLINADDRGLLDSVPVGRRHKSFHLVSPEGRVTCGSDAIPSLVALLPLGSGLAVLIQKIPVAQSVVKFLYSTMSRLHETGSCSYKSDNGSSFTDSAKLDELIERNRLDSKTKWNRILPGIGP
jgi:predicted DCC family thiol-disulfide oxidoreductase YuxK